MSQKDNLISRAEVLDYLQMMPIDLGYSEVERIEDFVKHLPSAHITSDVRHAKLLNAHPYGECSNCGYLIDIRDKFNYCPMCGCKFEVEE